MFDWQLLELFLQLLLGATLIAGMPMLGIVIGYLLGRAMPTVSIKQGVVIGLVTGCAALVPYFVLMDAFLGTIGSDMSLVTIHAVGYGASAVMTMTVIWLMALAGILFRK